MKGHTIKTAYETIKADLVNVQTADEGARHRAYRVRCSKCNAFHDVSAAGRRNGLPVEVIFADMRKAGWQPHKRGKHVCPKHIRPLNDNCQAVEAPVHIEPEQETAPMVAPTPLHAEEPRKPMRADKRRIIDELDACYDLDRNCYKAGETDEGVAKRLDVPRRWVSDIREDLFGPEKNMELEAARAELNAIRDMIKQTEDRIASGESEIIKARKDLDGLRKMVNEALEKIAA